jgi:hypothetical protein
MKNISKPLQKGLLQAKQGSKRHLKKINLQTRHKKY